VLIEPGVFGVIRSDQRSIFCGIQQFVVVGRDRLESKYPAGHPAIVHHFGEHSSFEALLARYNAGERVIPA
jgi:hypothetical protein